MKLLWSNRQSLFLRNKPLVTIFFLALFLRNINLGSTPAGFHADEIRVGWNAYSILHSGKDDRGNTLAAYYNTFGDYRPTGIFYITIPSILLFGLNEFAIRFPSALFGALTIFPLFLLTKKITKKNLGFKNSKLEIIASFMLAVSPWHISVSRATSEVVIAMFFALFGLYFLIKKKLLLSLVFIIISYLFYHSIRLLAPIFAFSMLYYYRQKRILFVIALAAITLGFISSRSAQARFNQVAVFKSNSNFVQEYLSYFSGSFLTGESAKPIRYKTPGVGVLTYFELIFLIAGVIYCIQKKSSRLPLILLLLAPLPAAITAEDAPNLHRSLFMLPFICVLMAYGILQLKKYKLILYLLILGLILNYFYFWNIYTKNSKYEIAQVRNYATKDLVLYLNEVHSNYEQVIITSDPDDPYPWYAFFNKLDPKEFNAFAIKRNEGPWIYQNLLFTQSECPSGDIFPNKFQDPLDKNILVVDGFKCAVESKIHDGMQAKVLKQFHNPNGTVSYTLWIKVGI